MSLVLSCLILPSPILSPSFRYPSTTVRTRPSFVSSIRSLYHSLSLTRYLLAAVQPCLVDCRAPISKPSYPSSYRVGPHLVSLCICISADHYYHYSQTPRHCQDSQGRSRGDCYSYNTASHITHRASRHLISSCNTLSPIQLYIARHHIKQHDGYRRQPDTVTSLRVSAPGRSANSSNRRMPRALTLLVNYILVVSRQQRCQPPRFPRHRKLLPPFHREPGCQRPEAPAFQHVSQS